MGARAFITGVEGLALTADEQALLRDSRPWGLILFRRNVGTPDQIRRLIGSFRDAVRRDDAPVLIDQEGGRVQRLGPPQWPAYPPGRVYGALYDQDRQAGLAAARLGAWLIGSDLADLGINVDCLPLADVPIAGADAVIGDRAYGNSQDKVAAIARAVADGLADAGVLPVLKHIPGHGRANADSHERLPVVDADREVLEATDFKAFRLLADLPLAMTAHVVYAAIDPVAPATTSPRMIDEIIRRHIGFDGALMSDDVSMGALSGTLAERTKASFAAGCDLVLHCNGRFEEMASVATEAPLLAGESLRRTEAALRARKKPVDIDRAAARAEFSAMMARISDSTAAT
ncbi:MAG: beta-N-acetylhexosaminidase [Variibacter sp.]